MTDEHGEAIEAVLERRGLALVLEQADGIHVVGTLTAEERRVWETVQQLGAAAPSELAKKLGLDPRAIEAALDTLLRRRLVMHVADDYVVVGAHRGG